MAEQFTDVPAWPEQAPVADAGPGHNNPPLEDRIKAEFEDALTKDRPDFMVKFADILGANERIKPVENDDQLANLGTLKKIIRAAIQHIDAVHKTVKEPWLAGSRAVDSEKKRLADQLAPMVANLDNHMNRYVAQREADRRAEQAQIEAEELARAREAERSWVEDAVPVASKTEGTMERIVRSDEGASVSSRAVWKSRVQDVDKAFAAVKDDPKVIEAIEAAVARRVRAGSRKIDGCMIWETAAARVG